MSKTMSICIFYLNPVEISDLSQSQTNETITHNQQIQHVELEKISEVESSDSESDIDPFTTMYSEMDEAEWTMSRLTYPCLVIRTS